MQGVLEAAKSGNLELLKTLKSQQMSFNETDQYGNTPLIIASCHGHLGIVKWLLSEECGSARITEKNKKGETALLLAAAYGQLTIVRWLLSRKGAANISETNNKGLTALFYSVCNGQLSVVDYLVREFYCASDSKINELLRLTVMPQNLALRYYLQICRVLFQKTVNFNEVSSLIGEAAKRLNDDECSYIQLLCCWAQIHSQVATSSSLNTVSGAFLDKLLAEHQASLLLQMFKSGYLITNWSNENGALVTTGCALDEYQKTLIGNWIDVATKDRYLHSKASKNEKQRCYVEYYLKPLYFGLIQALHTKDKYTNLTSPYVYHLSAYQAVVNSEELSNSIAYHLVRHPDTTLKDHRELYARASDKNRLFYYEIVKWMIGGSDKQKKSSLLEEIGNLPNSDGERLFWKIEYPHWIQGIARELGASILTEDTFDLIGLEKAIRLNQKFVQQIWNSAAHEPQPSQYPGNHPVYKLVLSEQKSVFCKLYPGLPGINDAL